MLTNKTNYDNINIVKRKQQMKGEQKMKRITINNGTMTKKRAIEIAKQYHKETGKPVEVCNTIGDTVLYLK